MSAHKRSINLFALVGSLLAIAFLVASSLRPTVRASGSGWLSGGPQIAKIADATQADEQGGPNCTLMTIPVVRASYQQLFTNNEQHCMVETDEGLVDDRVSVIQSFGAKGYVINSGFGGGHVLVPTPNYPGAMLFSGDSNYPGSDVGLYELLTNHLKFNNNLLAPAYNLTAPDLYFKYPNGHLMAFNGTGSFSSSGTYWVVQAVYYGFVRVNLTTLQITAFADNTMLDSGGYPQGAITAVSPTGKYAALAYNAPGDWGSKYFKIVDVDSCGNAEGAYVKSTSTCKTIDYFANLKQAIPGIVEIGGVQFANDNSLNFVAAIQSGSTYKYARYSVTAAGQPQRLEQYLALGDSFASGEGTFNYTSGTDELENKCHQSI
ncbi:MAG: hypothetical protein WC498_04140 [Candidatus Saccharimonadales bacterium]